MSSSSLPVLYPLRSVDTARVTFTDCPRGRRRITIDHRPLAGVTPAMLLDWFTHLGGTITYGGRVVDRYHAWHPVDHILWELARPAPGGGAAEGARFHMVEAFGARPEFTVDEVARVEKLDETGIRLVLRIAGVPVFQLEHTWSAGEDGAHYVTVMDLGVRSALLTPINRVLQRRFSDDKATAWVKHNIEEVGQLEYLLPGLAEQDGADQEDLRDLRDLRVLRDLGEPEPAQRAERRDAAPRRQHSEAEPVHR